MPRRVLIVDDLTTNRRILNGMLRADYDILEAASGEQALDILVREHETISAVLLDISMPGIDGYEVLRLIRANALLAALPVIMITGSEDEETRNRSLALGANDFVMKPYSSEIIRHCLRNNIALRETSATVDALQRDRLTGLYNREVFFDKVREKVAAHEPGSYVMACFDIDQFKVLNDQYGTAKGDEVLRHVADAFREGFEPNGGLCCRVFADNFAVLYPESFRNTADIEAIRERAAHVEGLVSPLIFSIGRYLIDDVSMLPAAMYDRASLAADTIKGRYDTAIAVYDEAIRERLLREQEIVTEMDDALKGRQFEVWYQPQYNHSTGAMIGAEALVRWRHPRKGLVSPAEFIPVFEKNGFIYSLDRFVWREVCAYLRRELDEGGAPLPISVNISRYDVFRPDIVAEIEGLVEEYRLPIDLLRLEITESAFTESSQRIVEVVRELVECGFTVEIDDFGSGYSSLNTLKDVPAQIIKLDMKFLQSSSDTRRGGNIVESVVRMAKWLGMSVIAEGVETKAQADYLRSIGCSYMQGYLFARPMPAEQYREFCASGATEEGLLTLETVENLDNNAFWDPASMDTLIFNSYVGGACIYEYHNGAIELLRATEKYAQVIGSAGMTVEDALKLNWSEHLDAESGARVVADLEESVRTRKEVTGEYVFLDLPGCPHETYLRSSMRVIASAGERYLVYCTNENITAQRRSEKREREVAEEMRLIMDNVNGGICAVTIGGEGKIRLIFANDTYYTMMDYTKEQAHAELADTYDVIHHDDRHIVKNSLSKLLSDGIPSEYEFRCIKRDGSVIYIRSNASLTSMEGYGDNVVISVQTDITSLVLAEQRAQKAAEQLAAIMENIDAGVTVTVVGKDNIRPIFANDKHYEMLGYTKAEYQARFNGIPGSILEEDRGIVMARCREVNESGRPASVEFRVKRNDGEIRRWRSTITLMSYPGESEPVQLAVATDITEQRETEQNNLRLSEQMQAVMTSVDLGIIAAVVEGDEARYIFANDYYYGMLGYTRAQFECEVRSPYHTIAPEDRQRVMAETARINHTGESTVLIYNGIKRDGSSVTLRAAISMGTLTGIEGPVQLSILRDITEETAIEQRERRAAEQLQSIMHDMPGGFVRVEYIPDGSMRPVYYNDGMLSLTEMSRSELDKLYENDVMAGVHPEDAAAAKEFFAKMLGNDEAHRARYRLRCGESGYIWLSVIGRRSGDSSGATYLNLYYTDASEQAALEQRQRELLDNLPGGAGLYELDGGELSVVHLNRSYWQLVGRSPSDYEGLVPLGAVHPDDMPIITREITSAIEQKRDISCDFRLRHETHGYQSVHLVGRIVPKEGGGYSIYTSFTPISDEAMSYQQMLPLLLSAMMDSTSDLSFAKDTELRYLSASRPFADTLGRSVEDIVGKTDFELFNAELAEKYSREDKSILESGEAIVDMVEAIPSVDGTPHYSSTSKYVLRDSTGEIIGLYGVGRDVTKAVSQDSRLRLVNDSIPGGIATYVCTSGDFSVEHIKMTYFNDGFCKLFGFSRGEYENRASADPASMVFEEDKPVLVEQWLELMKSGTPINCLYRAHVKTGGYKWISHRAVAADRRGGRVVINAIMQDVTEQRELIERLRISEEENNLAVLLGGNIVCRYTVADKTLSLSPEVATSYGLPETITGVPYEPVRSGMISPETADAYIGFFESILHGSCAATATYQQRYFNSWQWLEAKSSTIFSDDGTPVKAVISFTDVSERLERETIYKKWQQSLEDRKAESYTLYRCNLNNDASFTLAEGALISFDFESAGAAFNVRAREYVRQCVYEQDRDAYIAFANSDAMLASYYRGKRSDVLEYRELSRGGTRWLRLTVDLVESPNSTDVEAYMMYENIDESKKAELQTKALSETDPLTGLLNRTTFAASVERVIRASKPGCRHALLMLDIDGFKQVNDVFGHGAGDGALIDTANSLRSIIRRDDLVARLGGDEFMVFLNDVNDDGSVASKAKQICALTRRAFSMEVQISSSVGVAMIPRDGMDFETLYRKADSALYYVKGSGKDSFVFYNDDMAEEHLSPEPDAPGAPEKKRRMLIVDDSNIDHELLKSIFADEFIIEKAKDGNTALIRLRHYGGAISVVLLDLVMPGMNGFAVLEKMKSTPELQGIPVIVVSADDSRETCLKAVRAGATDFITKPVDAELIRLRVHSAVSRAENERLRAKNRMLEVQNEARLRYETALESSGVTFVEYNRLTGEFTYYPSVSSYLAGSYDKRKLWQILLSDTVADERTVQDMQQLVHSVAEDRERASGSTTVKLKTPGGERHSFRMSVRKLADEYHLTDKLIITLTDLDYESG